MISIQCSNTIAAAKQAFLALYKTGVQNSDDPALLCEDTAVIEVIDPSMSKLAFVRDKTSFRYTGQYAKYVLGIEKTLTKLEEDHYTEILLSDPALNTLVGCLRTSPSSRRILLSTWLPMHAMPTRPAAPCLTQLYFRRNNGKLEVHSHFRANDAYRLLLMDMQLVTSIQQEVARQLGLSIGRYIHFVDSLHFYKEHIEHITAQRDHVMQSPIWR